MVIKNDTSLLNESFGTVLDWMKENPNLIYHYVNPLMKRMSEIYKEMPHNETFNRLLHVLYIDKKEVCEIEFGLLEEAVSSFIKNATSVDHVLDIKTSKDDYPHLLLLFLFMYDIMNDTVNTTWLEEHTEEFYHNIIDVYIALCNNPNKIVKTFREHFKLKDALAHAHNTTWFIDSFKEKKLDESISIEHMLLLFKYVSDLYSNRETKVDFFIKLHDMILGTYYYTKSFSKVEDRYTKYFGENTREMIASLMEICDSKDENESSENTKAFVIKYMPKYGKNVSSAVMKCMMNDAIALSDITRKSNIIRTGNFKVQDLLYSMWGLDEYNHTEIDIDYHEAEKFSIELLEEITNMDIGNEASTKTSVRMNAAEKKIYKAYRNYKSAEDKVDSQITKAVTGIKGVLTGDVRSEIIEGKKFSAIGLLKRLLGTVALFSFSKIGAVIAIVVGYATKKSTRISERRKIIMELETEITMIDEKIRDARGDDNREAKYAMMRTKAELENALKKIRYGMEADTRSVSSAKSLLSNIRR